MEMLLYFFFFFSSRRRHTRSLRDWSSDVCSSDLCGGTRGSEVIQALPRVPPQPEQRMHLVVEKAADTGGADAGGFRLEVQNLPEHSAFPMERSIAPGVACRDLVMGEHPQRIAGVRGDVLVTADEPGGVAEVIGDEQ